MSKFRDGRIGLDGRCPGTKHTRVVTIYREPHGVQVTVEHGRVFSQKPTSAGRATGIGKWVAARLLESGSLDGPVSVSDVRTHYRETQVTLLYQ